MFSRLKKWFGRAKGGGQSYGLHGMDLKLLPWLDFRDGFFIEAGANDGATYSNTLLLERTRNWRGLLVEPIPELAAKCRQNRPACLVENCALVAADSTEREVPMRYCNMMSIVKGAMQSEAGDLDHIRKGCEVQSIDSYELTVPARALSDILDQHGITKIDFFSLDVEGYEMQALRGLDFTRHRPRFLLVECRDRPAIEQFLALHYEPVADLSHHDVLFRARPVRLADAKRIVIGAGHTDYAGWAATDRETLDLLKREDFARNWAAGTRETFLAEHVWEHLSGEQGLLAAKHCFEFLQSGGRLRIAVPDGQNPDPQYREHVRPGGTGPGADDHQMLYTAASLKALLESAGFVCTVLESWDGAGNFHSTDWDSRHGHIMRSRRFDPRNQDGKLGYTSLIIDAIKP